MSEKRRIADLYGSEYQICWRRLLGFFGSLSAADRGFHGRISASGGFRELKITKQFLPYTMAKALQRPIAFLRLYLKMPGLWRIFGRQFLIFARK